MLHTLLLSYFYTQNSSPLTISGPLFVPLPSLPHTPDSNRGLRQSLTFFHFFFWERVELSQGLSPSFQPPPIIITAPIEIANLLLQTRDSPPCLKFETVMQCDFASCTVCSSKGQTSKSVISYFSIAINMHCKTDTQHPMPVTPPTANVFHRLSQRPPICIRAHHRFIQPSWLS